jgi:hypothetical protein
VPRVTGKPSRRIDLLRDRGFRGGRIAPHRAMIGLEISWSLLIDLLVLPAIFSVLMFTLLDPIMSAWRDFFNFIRVPLGMPGVVATRIVDIGPFAVAVPFFNTPASWPTTRELQTGWLVMGVFATVGVMLRGRALPFGYLLRALAIVQLSAQLWFTLAAPPFGYTLPDYIAGLLVSGVVILLLASFLVAFTYHIFDFLLWQKLMMASLLLAHLTVLFPLQAAVHAWIIQRASLLALPVLFLVFGVLLDVFVYISLYGWGMSWRSGGPLDAVDRRPPVAPPRYPPDRPRPTPTPQSVPAITPAFGSTLRSLAFGGVFGLVWRRLAVGRGDNA